MSKSGKLLKINYLVSCIKKLIVGRDFSCPSCGCPDSTMVRRKYVVSALRRCKECQLLFRTPKTTAKENEAFYQKQYTQGFTTDCPSEESLRKYIETKFANTEKDYSDYIDILLAANCKKGDKLFDFGCSWGYGSWQFMQQGFHVESFEISRPRADYARDKLNVKVYNAISEVQDNSYDIFFSSHVLEHVPSVKESIEFGMRVLKPNGLFVVITPNGSEEYRQVDFNGWNSAWNAVHPQFLDNLFYEKLFADKSYLLLSRSYPAPYSTDEIKTWNGMLIKDKKLLHYTGDVKHPELLILVRK
jgi:2-polyprenyl-3-methyl-5-hydroxy-6-metoxy-1,4-benzoquinol methylase